MDQKKEVHEASLPLYKNRIEDQLDFTYDQLYNELPLDTEWGIKRTVTVQIVNIFWYGFKGHIAVETSSQFMLGSLLSSGNLNDAKVALPLLKGIRNYYPSFQINHATMDSGYDYPTYPISTFSSMFSALYFL